MVRTVRILRDPSGNLRVQNEGAASWFGDVDGGAWRRPGKLSNLLPQGSIQKEGPALTSDQRQLFPLALPATASPPTVPDIPQPSGQGTQTKGLQGAESWGNHTGFSEPAGKKSINLTKPKQTKSYVIPQRSLVKRKYY